MSVFNPNILDACMQAVTGALRPDEKADVLLHAARYANLERKRHAIENAVGACLLIPDLSPRMAARLRMLRVRARMAAGTRLGVIQDIEEALRLDPENMEAKAMSRGNPEPRITDSGYTSRLSTALSPELWKEVVSYLPHHALVPLFSVPHILSRFASFRYFEEITFNLTRRPDPQAEQDAPFPFRDAQILAEIISNRDFAGRVLTFRVRFSSAERASSFDIGMILQALHFMKNLRGFHFFGYLEDAAPLLQQVEAARPDLSELVLANAGSQATSCLCPRFGKLRRLVIMTPNGKTMSGITSPLLVSNADTLRYVTFKGSHLDIAGLNMRYITRLALNGFFLENVTQSFSSLMTEGTALEELLINPSFLAAPVSLSPVFRKAPHALPNLRIFKLAICNAVNSDADLFPAVVDFLRGRERLCMLQLSVEAATRLAFGYDATVWGVLPSLPNVRALVMGIPHDLAPGLAGWLLPRGLRALTLYGAPPPMPLAAVLSQLKPGVPAGLRAVAIDAPFAGSDRANTVTWQALIDLVVRQGFPMVHVVGLAHDCWRVQVRSDGVNEYSELPVDLFQRLERLETVGCEGLLPWEGEIIG